MSDLSPAIEKLKLKHLRLLALLAETGTLRKTAERLHLSQPAVSQALKEIESAFGGALFVRNRRGVVPNERLRLLMRRAGIALGEIQSAEQELKQHPDPAPVLRIGANLHLLTYLLPEVIRDMRAANPALRFDLREGSTSLLLRSLGDGELDCIAGRLLPDFSHLPTTRGIAFWPISRGELCVVVNHSHPLAGKRRVTLRDLSGQNWAATQIGGQSRFALDEAFLRAGLPAPTPVIECRPFHVNVAIALRSPLVTVAMRLEAHEMQKKGLLRILPLDLKLEATPIAFYCRTGNSTDTFIRDIRDTIMRVGRQIDGRSTPALSRRKQRGGGIGKHPL